MERNALNLLADDKGQDCFWEVIFPPMLLFGFDLFYEGHETKTSLPNAVGCWRMCDMAVCQHLN